MIFVDLAAFVKAFRCLFSRRWFSLRRLFWAGVALLAVTTVYAVNIVCRLLDEVFFSGYRKVQVCRPVIISANPRSGTTLLNRLLCLDESSFAFFRLYQTIFPSITAWRMIEALGVIDHAIGRPFGRIIARLNRAFFAGWEGIHDTGLDAPEEDEALFLFNFATPAVYMLFPFFREVPELAAIDDLAAWKRREIARYYEGCIKRLSYAFGGEKTVLCKSVLFPGRMETVLSVFPDARVVYLVRDPFDSIPSAIDMFPALWRLHSPEIPRDGDLSREWARLFIGYYRRFLLRRGAVQSGNLCLVAYRDLIADPAATTARLYRFLGLPLSSAAAASINEHASAAKGFRSGHRYSLSSFGIDPVWLMSELKDWIEEYGTLAGMPQGERYASEGTGRQN